MKSAISKSKDLKKDEEIVAELVDDRASHGSGLGCPIESVRYVKPVKFYLNIYFLDRKELVRNIIRSKVSRRRPVIRALAKRAAVALLKNGISERVASSLSKAIPKKMEAMGIISEAAIAYLHNSYVCLEVTMKDVDIAHLMEFNKGPEFANKVRHFLNNISVPMVNDFIISQLLLVFRRKMMEKLPTELRFKLLMQMNAELEIVATTEEELGPVLLSTIQHLNTTGSGADGVRAAVDSMKEEDA